MSVKPSILIIGILIGYLLGVLIYFFDNTSSKGSSFGIQYSKFSAVPAYLSKNKSFAEPATSLSTKEENTQLWFFRQQPLFLVWAIMHVIGVALCFAVFLITYNISKTVQRRYGVEFKQRLKSILLVFICLGLIVWASYTTAYGFDYVAHLIPLNNPRIKIYSLEALNYLAGAYSLINMMIISSVVEREAPHINEDDFNMLRNFFHTCLFMAAIVVAYATLASGFLYKALNSFYYDLYDPSHKIPAYFPVIIIVTLGLINSFLLSMFYFPNAQVFKAIKDKQERILVIKDALESVAKKPDTGFMGISSDMLETIKILFALLSPLLSGVFS